MSSLPPVLPLLLIASALFSAAEAALFTLATLPAERRPGAARSLLRHPSAALSTILLGNLLVNLAYFAVAGSWAGGFAPALATAFSVAAVLLLVLLAEILPKILAHRRPSVVGRWVLPPVWLLDFFLAPLFLRFGHGDERSRGPVPELGSEELEEILMEEGKGLLDADELHLLRRILELDTLRAGALRCPVQDRPRLAATESLERACQRLRERHRGWGPVADEEGRIVGLLELSRHPRGILVREAMLPIPILPELAPVARGLTMLRETGAPALLLVDEYGAEVGYLERGSIAALLLGLPFAGQQGPVLRALSSNRWEVDARLPLHDYRARFGDPGPVDPKLDTLGGLLSERLGRLPRPGDRVELGSQEHPVLVEVLRCEDAAPVLLRITSPWRRPEGPGCAPDGEDGE